MTQVQNEKQAEKEAMKARAAEMEAEEKKLNEGRAGKGLRVFLGLTRGRNPQKIQYEAFDESQTDTLPASLAEFMDITTVSDEKSILSFVIDGFNSAAYTAASDPVAEFVDQSWPDEIQKNFRTVVRNYSTGTDMSIEDSANLIKPAFVAAQTKAVAAKAAAAAAKI